MSAAGEPQQWGGVRLGNRLIDTRSVEVGVPVEQAFAPIQRIGGATGWYFGNWLWRLRGWLDLLVGGVGMRRGRQQPEELHVGETLDCWRVEEIQPGRRLRLVAEMKFRAERGWSLRSSRSRQARGSRRRQCSIRTGWPGWRIGI